MTKGVKKDTPPLLYGLTSLTLKGQLKLLSRLKPRLNVIDTANVFPSG